MRLNKTHLLLLILIIGPILLFNSYNLNDNGKGLNININTTNSTNDSYKQPTASMPSTPLTQLIPKVVCEECHLSGKSSVPQALDVAPHLNGGRYCLDCHTNLHTNHPINKDVTCEKCHGIKNETIPISGSDIVCVNCQVIQIP